MVYLQYVKYYLHFDVFFISFCILYFTVNHLGVKTINEIFYLSEVRIASSKAADKTKNKSTSAPVTGPTVMAIVSGIQKNLLSETGSG